MLNFSVFKIINLKYAFFKYTQTIAVFILLTLLYFQNCFKVESFQYFLLNFYECENEFLLRICKLVTYFISMTKILECFFTLMILKIAI